MFVNGYRSYNLNDIFRSPQNWMAVEAQKIIAEAGPPVPPPVNEFDVHPGISNKGNASHPNRQVNSFMSQPTVMTVSSHGRSTGGNYSTSNNTLSRALFPWQNTQTNPSLPYTAPQAGTFINTSQFQQPFQPAASDGFVQPTRAFKGNNALSFN